MLTAKGQTPQELAEEFIQAMAETNSGSKDMDLLFDAAVLKEKQPGIDPNIMKSITNVRDTGFDATGIPFIVNTQPHISRVLLSWICQQSSGIPEYITTMLGLYATAFYAENPKGALLTLEWVGEKVGKGKIVNFRQFFPWASVSKTSDGKNIFDVMTPDQLYVCKIVQ